MKRERESEPKQLTQYVKTHGNVFRRQNYQSKRSANKRSLVVVEQYYQKPRNQQKK